MFTNYRFDPAFIAGRLSELKAGLQQNRGTADFAGFGLALVARRLAKAPQCYREFGPYWWAVKAALKEAGFEFGDAGEPLVAAAYCGATVEETLVMAEEFKDEYLRTQFLGANQFQLDPDGEAYTLFDPDMEARAPQH